jgi:hypothetical protein
LRLRAVQKERRVQDDASAAISAIGSNSSAVSRLTPDRGPSVSRFVSIHSRYRATSGRSAVPAAAPPASAPSASIDSSTPGTSTVVVFSTSAAGIRAVRISRHSADTPWPVANSAVSA